MLLVENPGFCTVQEGGNDDGSVYLDLCGELERMTAFLSLIVFQKELLALDRWLSRVLLTVASLEMMLPR